MTAINGFQDLLDDGYLITTDAQCRLDDVVGPDSPYTGRFHVNLHQQTITFSSPAGDQQLSARLHFIGSAAPGPKSWMWGWQNVNQLADAVFELAARTRRFGEQYGITELTQAERPLNGEPRTDAWLYATVASLVNGQLPMYTCDAGGGNIVALLVEHPEFQSAPLTTPRLFRVLQESAGAGVIRDWKRALRQYATFAA